MNNSAEPPTNLDTRNPLMKWIDEMQDAIKGVTNLIEESDRQRAVAESAQRERDELREEVGKLHAEIDQLRMEQAEAGETAAKLLNEMTELVSRVAGKFQRIPRPSPVARNPRPPDA